MENKTIGILISVAVVLLMGVILIQIIADNSYPKTVRTAIASETINIAPARLAGNAINASYYFHLSKGCPYATAWRQDAGTECQIDYNWVRNSSGALLTDPTDVVKISNGGICAGYQSGDIRFANSALMNATVTNTTTVSYSYCADDYMTQSWSRTILNMVPGFFALGILLSAAFVIAWILKREGIGIDF
jgi:hypothetical protein